MFVSTTTLYNFNICLVFRHDILRNLLDETKYDPSIKPNFETGAYILLDLNSVSSQCARGKSFIARKPKVHSKIF